MSRNSYLLSVNVLARGLVLALFATAIVIETPVARSDELRLPQGFQILDNPVLLPDVKLTDANNKAVSLRSIADRIAILNVWATYCGPCIWEMPSLENLASRTRGKGLTVITVSEDKGGMPVAAPFLDRLSITSVVRLADPNGVLMRTLAVRGLPTTFVILDNKILARVEGPKHWDAPDIEEFLALLATSEGRALVDSL